MRGPARHQGDMDFRQRHDAFLPPPVIHGSAGVNWIYIITLGRPIPTQPPRRSLQAGFRALSQAASPAAGSGCEMK